MEIGTVQVVAWAAIVLGALFILMGGALYREGAHQGALLVLAGLVLIIISFVALIVRQELAPSPRKISADFTRRSQVW